jgi:hypothetical protein
MANDLDLETRPWAIPTDWIVDALIGISTYPQSCTIDGLQLCLARLIDALRGSQVGWAWGSALETRDPSLAVTARVLRALRRVMHHYRTSLDFNNPSLVEESVETVDKLLLGGVQFLLDHREHRAGWRFRPDSNGPLSWYASSEAVLALQECADLVDKTGEKRFLAGSANVAPAQRLTLQKAIGETAWWIASSISDWGGSVESDQDSVVEPWSRLAYATCVEAAVLSGHNASGFQSVAAHLDHLWRESEGLWGEWDGRISMPTVRGTLHATLAYDALRASLAREATEGRMSLPPAYEPTVGLVSEGMLSIAAGRVEVDWQGRTYTFELKNDLLRVFEAIVAGDAFGRTYDEISLVTNVPVTFLSTYVKRINLAAAGATAFGLTDMLSRLPSVRPAKWRLSPKLSLQSDTEYESEESTA